MKYKLLGKTGLKVSELCLGTMGFGTDVAWGMDFDTTKKVVSRFVDAGGNFLDTANRYTNGTSEKFIGDLTQTNRDFFVLATKYSLITTPSNNVNAAGNSVKNMKLSLEASLKRLKTDYIDLFYLHIWDGYSPIEEVMRGMEELVKSGKVMYIGISDTPAWIISKGQTYAEMLGWNSFAALQVEYSLLQRSTEADLLPMANHFGMSILPWAPLAGGALTGKYLRGEQGRITEASKRRNERAMAITKVVMAIAAELNCDPSAVALQWIKQRYERAIPIVGVTKLAQLDLNLQSIHITLSDNHIYQLNEASSIEYGFPHEFVREENVREYVTGGFDQKISKRAHNI